MKWFSNQKIKAKMIISFGLIILMMAALSVLSTNQILNVDNINNYIIDYPQERNVNLMQMQSYIRDLRRSVVSIAMYTPQDNDTAIDSAYSDANYAYGQIVDYLNKYEENVRTDKKFTTSDINSRLTKSTEIKNILEKYKSEIADPMVPLSKQGNYEAVMDLVYVGGPLISTTTDTLTELINTANSVMLAEEQHAKNAVNQTVVLVIVISSIATLIGIIVALFVARLISKPINILTDFMKKAGSTGDISLRDEDVLAIQHYGAMKDEVGQTISATASFVQHVSNIADNLNTISNGDLTVEVTQISENDIMGNALKNMTDNLNSMFLEINSATSQVASGSQQIADGAQMLAQGATEQAATIEELSSEISQIAGKTEKSAEIAGEAAQLANIIKNNAEKGSHQMSEMMSAVNDINQASQSISKVIKVIDDIAFQTNILALNAAVEAARAGQHGKGFAVVADEVRNLAAKSASAAKETGELILSSTEKAETGTRIAKETSESLIEIVNGINQSSQIISEIAKLSEEQSYGTQQINSGIDQVAQVVQQNSATAEESAAASEEMSGQAMMLEELINKVKLKDAPNTRNTSIGIKKNSYNNSNKY